jgi:hypothetical protein
MSNLRVRLERATANLLYMSETDAPLHVVEFDAEPDASELRRLADAPDAPVAETTAAEFFGSQTAEYDGASPERLEAAGRFRALQEMMGRELSDLRVWRVGTVEIRVFAVGRTLEGWMGIATSVVET